MDIKVKFKKIAENAEMPAYATEWSACCDLKTTHDVKVPSHGTAVVHTGICVEPERPDCVLKIYARSGLACKHGIVLANGTGIIDSDYRGEIVVVLQNTSSTNRTIYAGERVAQMMAEPTHKMVFEEADELSTTDRGEGGFGSTGK